MPSQEVNDAVGEAPSLEERAAELRQQVAERDELAKVEQQLAAKQRATDATEVRAAAEKRLLGIVRAVGSLMASSEQDDYRVLQTAKAYAEAMQTLDGRFVKYVQMCDEAKRLAAATGLPMPTLPPMPIPGLRPAVDEARIMVYHDVPVRGTAHGLTEEGDFEKTEGGQIVTRFKALNS